MLNYPKVVGFQGEDGWVVGRMDGFCGRVKVLVPWKLNLEVKTPSIKSTIIVNKILYEQYAFVSCLLFQKSNPLGTDLNEKIWFCFQFYKAKAVSSIQCLEQRSKNGTLILKKPISLHWKISPLSFQHLISIACYSCAQWSPFRFGSCTWPEEDVGVHEAGEQGSLA